jgi:hypothetical protein
MKGNPSWSSKQSNLTALSAIDEDSLDKWFELCFTAADHVIAAFYNNVCIYGSLGKELCIALDIALAAGGCEAVVCFSVLIKRMEGKAMMFW